MPLRLHAKCRYRSDDEARPRYTDARLTPSTLAIEATSCSPLAFIARAAASPEDVEHQPAAGGGRDADQGVRVQVAQGLPGHGAFSLDVAKARHRVVPSRGVAEVNVFGVQPGQVIA